MRKVCSSAESFSACLAHARWSGRVFTAEDDRPGCGSPGAVIGYSFWQSEFAEDPAITSRTVRLDGRLFPIIGVTAPEFFRSRNRPQIRCRRATLFRSHVLGAGQRPHSLANCLVALDHGTAEAGLDDRARQRADPGDLAGSHASELPEEYRADNAKKFLANKLIVTSGATGVSQLRRPLSGAALDSPRHHRPGAAHRVRESGESFAGPRQRARA